MIYLIKKYFNNLPKVESVQTTFFYNNPIKLGINNK